MDLARRFFLLLFFFLTLPHFAQAEVREIRIKAAVSPTFKANTEWEQDIRDRIIFINKFFGPLFQIHFSINQYIDWTPQDETRETDLLMEELRGFISLGANEAVIGFHRMSKPFGREHVDDIDIVGSAQFFRGFIVIRDPFTPLSPERSQAVMAHEAFHLFGAVHISDASAIMNATLSDSPEVKLDEENKEIIKLTRNVDFTQGLPSLSQETITELIRIYERNIRKHPHSDFYYQLGKFYQHLNQQAKAVSIWEEALVHEYDNPYIHYELGLFYYQSSRYQLAIREIGSAIAHFILPSQKKMKANALNFLGTAYYETGNTEQAIFNWLKGLSADPDNADLQGNLAVAYLNTGNVEKGISELEKLAAKNPNDVTTLSNLGAACLRAKKPDKAVEYLELALQKKIEAQGVSKTISSEDPAAIFQEVSEAAIRTNLGAAYLDLHESALAVAELEKAKALDPGSFDIRRNLAQGYLMGDNFDGAIGEAKAALSVKKEDPYLYAFLGQAYASLGKRQEAIHAASEGLRYARGNDSLSASFHKNLGILFAQDKRFAEAVSEFRTSLNLQWNDPETHLHLGIVQARSGNMMDARRALKNALTLDPSHSEAKRILQSLPAEER